MSDGVYGEWKASMAAENLVDVISSLTPQERESVKQFIEQHPELLRRLAQ